jgi:predicted PurR-regulated permease PerM
MAVQQSSSIKIWITLLTILGIAFVCWLCWISLPVLIPLLVGVLLAYLLWPLVAWLEKILPPRGKERQWKRAAAVIIVIILLVIILIVLIAYIGAAIISASVALADRAPAIVTNVTASTSELLKVITVTLPADMTAKLQEGLANAGPKTTKFMQDFLVGSIAVIPTQIPTIMAVISLPFFLIFVLLNYEKYGRYFSDIFPAGMARHTTQVLKIFGDQMGRYIRMALIMAAIAGALVFTGTALLGVQYAAALGAVTAMAQLIPIVGPFISAAVVLVVTFALNPGVILWVIGIFVATQVIVALIQGPIQEKHFPLDPAIVMVLMTVGGFLGFYWGIILALPVGATAWNIYKYFRDISRAKQLETRVT